ncbi:S24 family peptidase [Brevibacillus laterosporus]|uniref:S24 family peptidase n=1 Tax=Brevibacillus laterosporus TaxID=1465 RepID=A0A518V662_BRELA|nr:S24 family peptidase [Brevibacillus laterosporus]
MDYYKMLIDMIEKSGLTLQEIANRCEVEHGVKINRSYISKLQTRKQAPASDEVNVALAKVCGGDVEKFRYEGYIEKAPDFIKDFIQEVSIVLKEMSMVTLKKHFPEKLLEKSITEIDNRSALDILEISKKYLAEIKNGVQDLFDPELMLSFVGFEMKDDSMEPVIPKGSIVNIDYRKVINNGDIVFVSLVESNEENYLIRRAINLGDKVMLISEKSHYEAQEIEKKAIKHMWKVTATRIEF